MPGNKGHPEKALLKLPDERRKVSYFCETGYEGVFGGAAYAGNKDNRRKGCFKADGI